MQSREFSVSRAFFLRLDPGDDLLQSMNDFVISKNIQTGIVQGIGGLAKARYGLFRFEGDNVVYDIDEKDGPLELLLSGNVTMVDGKPFVHVHVFLNDHSKKGTGGHLMPGCEVNPTAEISFTVTDGDPIIRNPSNTGFRPMSL